MEDRTKIVIVGGGYAGVTAALELEKHFRKNPGIDITLVDRHSFHTLMTELHEVAGARVGPESVQVPYRKIFGARRVRVVRDEVTGVDFEGKKVKCAKGELPYDYLVVGTGAEPEYFGVQGVAESAFTLWSIEDALKIRAHVQKCFEDAAAEGDPEVRKRLLSIVVAGSGFTGVELAGELLEWRVVLCRKHNIPLEETSVALVEALPDILPILDVKLRAKAEKRLLKLGARLMKSSPIVGAEPGRIRLKDGSQIEAATFVWTCGVRCSRTAASLGLASGKAGRVVGDETLRAAGRPEVRIVGDALWREAEGKALPQIVETAIQTGETAAANIIASIEGSEPRAHIAKYHGFMVSIGSKYCVSNAGGFRSTGFVAMAMKHLINLHYLLGIGGINQCWEYLKHEFFDMKEGRSFLGSLVSYRVRGHWPLLLRLWLGFMWIVEAVNKITEGWLDFSGGESKTGWLFTPGTVQAGTKQAAALAAQAADAVSAASDAANAAAPAAAEVAPAADAVSAASDAVNAAAPAAAAAAPAADAVSAASDAANAAAPTVAATPAAVDAAHQAAAQAGPWLDPTASILDKKGPLATWFVNTFMDGVFAQVPFGFLQTAIVSTELLIGLAIFGGFFTWWAAALSIVMCVMFTLSGVFAWNQLWFVFAAVLMMGGAGRTLGLDSWSVPWLKRKWNGTAFARRRRLYLDDPSK